MSKNIEVPGRTENKKKPIARYGCMFTAGITLVGSAFWISNAIATEATDHTPFPWKPPISLMQKATYDLFHPFDWIQNLHKTQEISPNYDSTSTEPQIIKGGVNAIPLTNMTQEKIDELFEDSVVITDKSIFPKIGANSVSIILPAKLGGNKTVETFPKIKSGEITYSGKTLTHEQFYSRIFYYDKGTQIPLFVSKAEIFQTSPKIINGKTYFRELVVRQAMSDGNIIAFFIKGHNDIRDISPSKDLGDIPIVSISKEEATDSIPYWAYAENGIPLSITADENGEINAPTILTATRDNAYVSMTVRSSTCSNIVINLITKENQPDGTKVLFIPQ